MRDTDGEMVVGVGGGRGRSRDAMSDCRSRSPQTEEDGPDGGSRCGGGRMMRVFEGTRGQRAVIGDLFSFVRVHVGARNANAGRNLDWTVETGDCCQSCHKRVPKGPQAMNGM